MDDDEEILDKLLEEEEEGDEDIQEENINNNEHNKKEEKKEKEEKEKKDDEAGENLVLLSEVLENKNDYQKNDSTKNQNNNINNIQQKKEEVINNGLNNLKLNNLYPDIHKKEKKKENDVILPLLNDYKKYSKNNDKVEIPYQTLEERTFLTEQINKNKNKKFNTQLNNANNKNNKSNIIKNSNVIKEEEPTTSKSAIKKKKIKIKLIKYKKIKPDKIEIQINEIIQNSRKSRNNFEKVEEAYNILKPPLYEILSKPETTDQVEIVRQNGKMLIYLDLLNKILSLVSDNPIPVFKKKKNLNEQKKNIDVNKLLEEEKKKIESNNEQIIKNYDKEIDHMKSILEKIRNEDYEKNLDQEIKTRKEHLLITKKKIADIKLKIKQRELEQEHEQKKNKKEMKLKNLICDYKIKRKEKAVLLEKIEKDKNNLIALQQLKEKFQDKIENKKKQANDLYGLSEIKSLKEINNIKLKYKNQEINKYKKQILEKQTVYKQQNFEKLILGCQRIIKNLKEQKKRLEEEIKCEEEIKENVQKKLNAFYYNKKVLTPDDKRRN